MAPYVLVLGFSLFLLVGSLYSQKGPKGYLLIATVVTLTIFAGLRGQVGTDTASYHHHYEELTSAPLDLETFVGMEPIFSGLIEFSYFAFDSPYGFTALVALLQGVLLFLILQRHPNAIWFALIYVCTFYLRFHFNTLRTGCAILFLGLALVQPTHQAIRKYLLACAAPLAHYSAVTAVPLFTRPKNIALLSIFIIIVVFSMPNFADAIAEYIQKRVAYYFLTSGFFTSSSSYVGIGAVFIFSAVTALFLFSRDQADNLTSLVFVTWLILKILSLWMVIFERIEVIFLFLLLLQLTRSTRFNASEVSKALLGVFCIFMLYANFQSMYTEEERLNEIVGSYGELNPMHLESPFLPYRTFLSE